jgi:DNA-binding transcriptional LysR family regulator
MNYTLHQLQVFLKVAEKESITLAAEELFLTQPAVSIQLKNFQDQFPIPLTEVVGRKLFVTDFGREIAEAAQKIINEVYAINYKTLAFQGNLSGRLKLSVVSTGKYVMPFFLTDFMRDHDRLELIMDVTNKLKVIRALERNEIDFALVSVLPENIKINAVPLLENKLFFVGSGGELSDEHLNKKQLFETKPLIFRESGSATRNAMEDFISKNKYKAIKKMELTSNEAVKQAVVAGLGYSIMPLIGIKNELKNKDLKIVQVKGLPLSTTWNLVWLQSKKLSPAAAAFLEYIEKEKERIIKENFSWINAYNK